MTNIEAINLGLGVLGSTLGIVGTIISVVAITDQKRVRIKVVPKIAIEVAPGSYITTALSDSHTAAARTAGVRPRWCIQVVNLSAFAITVNEVGFGDPRRGFRGVIVTPELAAGMTWPARLEPRQSVVAYAGTGDSLPANIASCPYAYAETDCGKVKFGTSDILKEIANQK
jgi:hypothetical protein